jgi:hypothetical protein
MNTKIRSAFALVIVLGSSFAWVACDDDRSSVKETTPPKNDAGPNNPTDGGNTAPDASDCFENPKTHFEIINACTTATKIAKTPTLSKLLDGGALPPLP